MSTSSNNPNRLAFSSQCLPGSVAEQKEAERLAEFHRAKALRKAEAEGEEPQARARREEKLHLAFQANRERMHRNRMPAAAFSGTKSPDPFIKDKN